MSAHDLRHRHASRAGVIETKEGLIGMVRRSMLRRNCANLKRSKRPSLALPNLPPARAKRKKAAADAGVDLNDSDRLNCRWCSLPHRPPRSSTLPRPGRPSPSPNFPKYGSSATSRSRSVPLRLRPTSLAARFKDYTLPSMELLAYPDFKSRTPADESSLREIQQHHQDARHLRNRSYGCDITKGPAITRYEVYPSEGLRVSRIANLEADLARATQAERINILAPIPGKDTVGIELPNSNKIVVPIRELLETRSFLTVRPKFRWLSARTSMAKRSSRISPRCRTFSWLAPRAAANRLYQQHCHQPALPFRSG